MIVPSTRSHPLLGRSAWNLVMPVRVGGSTGRVGTFGPTRRGPGGETKLHNGTDFLCVEGRPWPVFAAHTGIVGRTGLQNATDPTEGYGLRLYIHGLDGDTETIYAHLSKIQVESGQHVQTGQTIGYTGRTGNVGRETPTHLHFGVSVTGKWIDPEVWLQERE